MLHGVFVTASIPAGKVIAFGKDEALAEPGVIRVLTHEDMPRSKITISGPPFAHSFLPLQDNDVRHDGQPVALVLGESLEAAEAGARKVSVIYGGTTAKVPVPVVWSELDPVSRSLPRATQMRASLSPRSGSRGSIRSRPAITIRWNRPRPLRCGRQTT
jgi:CO/xanthine dehydrogenase Mo-binding subunit